MTKNVWKILKNKLKILSSVVLLEILSTYSDKNKTQIETWRSEGMLFVHSILKDHINRAWFHNIVIFLR